MKKKITQKYLAEYLGLSAPTISEYKKNKVGKKKLYLMLKGLEYLEMEKTVKDLTY